MKESFRLLRYLRAMTIGARGWRGPIEQDLLSVHLVHVGMARRTTHIFVAAFKWKRRLVVIE